MRSYIVLFFYFAFLVSSASLSAQEIKITDTTTVTVDTVVFTFPEATGTVNDLEGLFTGNQIAELEKTIADFKARTGNEIVVASIASIGPYEKFDEYALDLSNYWNVGTEENNGLTLLFSKSLRQIRISTGTGTETVLTDEECKKVIDEIIVPELKKGDFYEGVRSGVKELILLWQ